MCYYGDGVMRHEWDIAIRFPAQKFAHFNVSSFIPLADSLE
jgi:hypothetical protein